MQFDLPLGWPADASPDAFLIGEANARAVHLLEHRASWPIMVAMLVGPRKSGRSLLSRIFAVTSGGTVIDNADRVDEITVFHAWNAAQSLRKPLLLIADAPPPEWAIALPDLRSRIAATPVLRIQPPDDALSAALFQQLFDRRHIVVASDLIGWLTKRIERSYVAILRTVDAIEDDLRGHRGRKLSIRRVRTILGNSGMIPASDPRPYEEDA